ncbi:hypothetical protein B0H11DRAFT_2386636 [Mycena galericulata]|nr:hypothetical protein B0H11DRAFT_2386636 [Mycena galericulata]
MHRTLPQYQASTSTSSSTTPGRKKARSSGPPRAYSTPVARLEDFAATSSAPVMLAITVGLLPKVLSTSDHCDTLDPSPQYSWKTNVELEAAQRRLQFANLIFSVEVNPSDPVLQPINDAFLEHCSNQNLDFLAPTPSTNGEVYTTPNNVPWVLVGPKGRNGNKTWVEDPKCLTQFTLTVSALRASPYCNTPNYLGDGIFIFIAPRLRNLFGPIDHLFDPITRRPDHVLTHRCFARRVLHPILTCNSLAADAPGASISTPEYIDMSRPLMSIDSDDSEGEDYFPEADALILSLKMLQRVCSLKRLIALAKFLRGLLTVVNGRQTPNHLRAGLLLSVMDTAPVSVKSRSFLVGGPIDLTLRALPGAGSFSLAAWQNHISEAHGPADEDLMLTAASVDLGARALIAFCIWLQSVRQPPSVKLKEVLQEQFASPRPSIQGPLTDTALLAFRVHIGPGFGKGPRAEVIVRAVEIITADPFYWADCGQYKTLRLHPSLSPIPRRAAVLKAAGLIFLLHYLNIGAPIPVSPFIFSTLFNGRQTASRFDLDFLTRFLSRESLTYIKRFHSTALDEPMYTSQSEDCVEYQYLINIPGLDPSLISRSRSEEEHEGVCATIISFVTLGSTNIQNHPDFTALGDGFNVALKRFSVYDETHHSLTRVKWFETPCRELMISTYDRCIKVIGDVLPHIIFSETNGDSDPWGENAETIGLIKSFLLHYLARPGHPHIPGRILEALDIDMGAHRDDPLVRVRLFMAVMTGSVALPVDPVWALKVTIIHDWDEAYPFTDDTGTENYGPEAKASFQSC